MGFFLFGGTWQSSALLRSGKPLKSMGWLSSCSLRFWSCKKVYTNWQVDFWRCEACKPKQEKSLVHLQALRVTSSCRCSLILAPILPVPLCNTGTKGLGKTSGGKRSCDTFQDEQWHYYFLLWGEKQDWKLGRSGLSALSFPCCLHHPWWWALTSCSKPQGCPLLWLFTVNDTTGLALTALFRCYFSTCLYSKKKILTIFRQWLGM